MIKSIVNTLFLLCLLLITNNNVNCHMEMKYPAPRLSPHAGIWDYTQVDYDINSPLNMKGNTLCQGKPASTPTATLNAGQTITVQIVGSAPHKGGHCQFSLSYDGGQNYVVIKDHLRTCPLEGNYQVTIPPTAPESDKVVFAWSWVNAEGNREYYMNCADVIIKQSNSNYKTSGTITGKKLLVVNQPGHPTIGEFLGNNEKGLELFNARPTITVKLSGSTTTPPVVDPPTPPKPVDPPTPTDPIPPKPTDPKPTDPKPTEPTNPGTNCRCLWAGYCGPDSCGVSGTNSACSCSNGQVCMGGPYFQCKASSGGNTGPTVPIEEDPNTNNPPVIPPPNSNCRCLWAGYCGADTCGVSGSNSACRCGSNQVCTGTPYFQCRVK